MNKLLAVAFTLMLVAACSKEPASINGKEYKLVNTPDNAVVTIAFEETGDKFSGQAPVNRYFGSYVIEGEAFTFGPAGSTMMAGPENLMKAEYEYLQFLPTVKTYKVDGKKLTLSNEAQEELIFEEIEPVK